MILAIETSCDDTSVALLEQGGRCVYQISKDQIKVHKKYGGVVPEDASRAHSEVLMALIHEALEAQSISLENDISVIAVTNRPGLMGALIVGAVTANTLAMVYGKKIIGINHLEGHIWSPWISEEEGSIFKPLFPHICLAVSGGHTQLYLVEAPGSYSVLGKSIDDAAGEALDKLAKSLDLDFPGGVYVDQLARHGNPDAYPFPIGIRKDKFNFSFSGVKAASLRLISSLKTPLSQAMKQDVCASFEKAITQALLLKLKNAIVEFPEIRQVTIVGGVSANTLLRNNAKKLAQEYSKELVIPPQKFCTDNAAMIGRAACWRLEGGIFDSTVVASPRSHVEDFKSWQA